MKKITVASKGGQTVKGLEITEFGHKYCTGDFVLKYWNNDLKETVTETKSLSETFEHINNVGWPFDIYAVLKSGGKTFANLLSKWDEENEIHWYVIRTMSGDWVANEKQLNKYWYILNKKGNLTGLDEKQINGEKYAGFVEAETMDQADEILSATYRWADQEPKNHPYWDQTDFTPEDVHGIKGLL